jgi:hypothetical protein
MGITRTSILKISAKCKFICQTTRDLALLAALSLFCAGFAWSWGYVILGSVFFALGVVAALGIAQKYWR